MLIKCHFKWLLKIFEAPRNPLVDAFDFLFSTNLDVASTTRDAILVYLNKRNYAAKNTHTKAAILQNFCVHQNTRFYMKLPLKARKNF